MKDMFIEKSKITHGDKYRYDKVNYINSITKVEIICKLHGSFFVRPDAHVRKVGCPNCKGGIKYDKEQFIKKCIEVHGDKYTYDETNYINSTTKVIINCPNHGSFNIRPANLLHGQGCSKCSGVYRKNTIDFINESNIVHNGLYNYDDVNYLNNRTKVKIFCNKHGIFEQIPKDHLNGSGCNLCKVSKGEMSIVNLLDILGIRYERNKIFDSCKGINNGNLPFDFYINDIDLLIEYDGRQHFEPVIAFGGKESFDKQVINDDIRNRWCLNNNIEILRLSYNDGLYKSKLISVLSKKYNYDFSRYIETYNTIYEYLRKTGKTIKNNYIENGLSCDFLIQDCNIAIRLIGFKSDNNILKESFSKIGIDLINISEDTWLDILKRNLF